MALFQSKATYKLNYMHPTTCRKLFLICQSVVYKNKPKRVKDRSSFIPWVFLRMMVHIYNGRRFTKKRVRSWLVGYRFGEFTWNRKMAVYKAKQKRKKAKKVLKNKK